MEKISNVEVKEIRKNSKFLRASTMEYALNGRKRTWDVLNVHDGVSVLIFNTSRNVFVFVKQFRPVLYVNKLPREMRIGRIDTDAHPVVHGVTIELCAGIVDKKLTLKQVAAEEVLEECGYSVDADSLVKIVTYRSGPGRTGTPNTLYYCEVTDEMKIKGDKKEDLIDVIEMSVDEAKDYSKKYDIESTAVLLFALNWFFINKIE